jgi:SAM-dependent methyltransferase
MRDDWLPMPRYKLRKDLVRKILKREAIEGKTCLELGYGAGDMLLMYAARGLAAYGYDISEQAFQNAKRRIENHPHLKEKIYLYQSEADIYRQKYAYVMAFEVLEHIKDDASCLIQWWDMLEPKGRLLISVPAHANKWGASDVAAGHYRRYEKEELTKLLRNTGFGVLHFWNYAYPISMLLDIFLHRKYRAESTALSKEELSKQSGIKRQNNLLNRFVASDLFLFPFILSQRLFLDKDLSSAYLIIAEKMPNNRETVK